MATNKSAITIILANQDGETNFNLLKEHPLFAVIGQALKEPADKVESCIDAIVMGSIKENGKKRFVV